MPHFCSSKFKLLRTDWCPQLTNAHIRKFKPGDLNMIDQHIGQFFDAHLADPSNRVSVPLNCPNPWPSVLAPVWLACNRDEEEAAKFLGNLYCRYAIKRPELWWSFPYAVIEWKPRLYVVHHHLIASQVPENSRKDANNETEN
jgi:hypothetical protein